MEEERARVRFNREPPVWCGDHHGAADTNVFSNKRALFRLHADVLDYGIRHHEIESSVSKWKAKSITDQLGSVQLDVRTQSRRDSEIGSTNDGALDDVAPRPDSAFAADE